MSKNTMKLGLLAGVFPIWAVASTMPVQVSVAEIAMESSDLIDRREAWGDEEMRITDLRDAHDLDADLDADLGLNSSGLVYDQLELSNSSIDPMPVDFKARTSNEE